MSTAIRNRSRPPTWAAVVLTLLLIACSRDATSPETQIRELVARAQIAAEARDVPGLRALITDDYADAQGNDRKAVENMLRLYILRNQSIHLFIRVRDIVFLEPERATARVAAAMAGRSVVSAGELTGMDADLYRFDLELVRRGGNWQVQRAAWEPARLDDFL
ncbi:MAG: nuclear transport factor 2 family protein [Candidatus Contendobacter sp.]|nr:nuclear transport factor 2 family protein [Candidatus Contendobacter sp.]MDG4556189.1 nuclear transport factor 2 family protein [Candidatus Contendobacter sp.]